MNERIKRLLEERAATMEKAEGFLKAAEDETRDLTEEEGAEFKSLMEKADKQAEELKHYEELEQRQIERIADARRAEIPEGDGGFRDIGEFMYSVRFKQNDPRLHRDQVMGTDTKGGFLVPDQFSTTILQVTAQEAIIRPRATVIPADPTSPDATLKMPALDYDTNMYGGVTVAWIDEQEAKPETEFALKQVTLTPYELAGYISVSDKLLRNSAASGLLIEKLLRGAIIAAEDVAFLMGDGNGEPTGIIGSAAAVEVPRDSGGAVGYGDLVSMLAALRGSGVFIASPTTIPSLMTMEDTEGHLVWQPSATAGVPSTIFGLPLLRNERSPALGTEGDVVLADLSYYLIKDGYGIAVAASEHFRFTDNTTVVKAFKLVDGKPWLTGPLTLEDGTTEVSPFVVLAGAGT